MSAIDSQRAVALAAAGLCVYAVLYFLSVSGPIGSFTGDETIYRAMAQAMAERGSLAFVADSGVAGAPPLSIFLSHVGERGEIFPFYPPFYALIAAPFYALGGVRGLVALNALSGLAALGLTYALALKLGAGRSAAMIAAGLFGGATFFTTYAFAIWPHMLALALLLGAAYCVAAAAGGDRQGRILSATGGALGAVAIGVRVDSVLVCAAVFLWLRLFGAPDRRGLGLAFLAGAAPLLFVLAAVNQYKFGAFSPISYGEPSSLESLGAYGPLASIGSAALVAAAIAQPAALYRRISGFVGIKMLTFGCAFGTVVALAIFHESAWRLARNFWVLFVDLQAYDGDYFKDRLQRDDAGFLTAWGLPKKALFQSLPFAALAIAPATELIRGRNVRLAAFCFAFALAPCIFYTLKQWHGAGSLNMRFFLPAVPMLCILSGAALAPALTASRLSARMIVIVIATTGFAYASIIGVLIDAAPRYAAAIVTYPTLIFAAAAAATAILDVWKGSPRTAKALVIAGFAAAGVGAATNFEDLRLSAATRAEAGSIDRFYAQSIDPGSLVITISEDKLSETLAAGVHLFRPTLDNSEDIIRAARLFHEAERCVYVADGEVADLLASRLPWPLAPANAVAAADARRNWFLTPADERALCAL